MTITPRWILGPRRCINIIHNNLPTTISAFYLDCVALAKKVDMKRILSSEQVKVTEIGYRTTSRFESFYQVF